MTESSVTIVVSFCTVPQKNHHCTTGLVGVGRVGTVDINRRVMLSARNKEGKGPHTMYDGANEEPECDSISTGNRAVPSFREFRSGSSTLGNPIVLHLSHV